MLAILILILNTKYANTNILGVETEKYLDGSPEIFL
jgi:hypothetical protein